MTGGKRDSVRSDSLGHKPRTADDSLLLAGEDLKRASGEHLVEHVEEGNGHPGRGQSQGHERRRKEVPADW